MKNYLTFIVLIIILITGGIFAQSIQLYSNIGDLRLSGNKVISNCTIGYRTFGKLNSDSSNVIIFPTWFDGTTNEIGKLIQKYSFLDTTKYFIIGIDALGNGLSSSPSNYNVYRINEYPDISIHDMVNSQFQLLTKIFNFKHIFAAVGGSLGGMQVLEWSAAYPGFMDKIVAYVSTPKLSSYEKLWITAQLDLIENGIKYGESEKEIRKTLAMLMAGFSRTPDYLVERVSDTEFDNFIRSFDKDNSSVFTLRDYQIQLKAILKHDIYKNFDDSIDKTVKAIKAKFLFIISETDLLVNPTEVKKFAELTGSKVLLLDNNCGHLAVTCEMEKVRNEITSFLAEKQSK